MGRGKGNVEGGEIFGKSCFGRAVESRSGNDWGYELATTDVRVFFSNTTLHLKSAIPLRRKLINWRKKTKFKTMNMSSGPGRERVIFAKEELRSGDFGIREAPSFVKSTLAQKCYPP